MLSYLLHNPRRLWNLQDLHLTVLDSFGSVVVNSFNKLKLQNYFNTNNPLKAIGLTLYRITDPSALEHKGQ